MVHLGKKIKEIANKRGKIPDVKISKRYSGSKSVEVWNNAGLNIKIT